MTELRTKKTLTSVHTERKPVGRTAPDDYAHQDCMGTWMIDWGKCFRETIREVFSMLCCRFPQILCRKHRGAVRERVSLCSQEEKEDESIKMSREVQALLLPRC